jgi:hypothetical protein
MNKEKIYTQKILPKLEEILSICEKQEIGFITAFFVPTKKHPNLTHGIFRSFSKENPPERIRQALCTILGKSWEGIVNEYYQSEIAQNMDTEKPFLRSKPKEVSKKKARKKFKLDKDWRPLEYTKNDFEDKGEVIIDHATGLMWQKAGSSDSMRYEQAVKRIEGMNFWEYAGYNDWRLPTIPELMSLLESKEQSNDLHINPIFDETQKWCWSADRVSGSSSAVWYVRFNLGDVDGDIVGYNDYVRAVRSWQ